MEHTETVDPAVQRREAKKQQSRFIKRKKAIASWWGSWLAFEKPFREQQPAYLKKLYDLSRQISQARDLAWNIDHQRIGWDDARDRVLTLAYLESLAGQFGKRHIEIVSDVGRIANHSRNVQYVNNHGEGPILHQVICEFRELDGISGPTMAPPDPPPLVLRSVKEIKEYAEFVRTHRKAVACEFHSDDVKQPATETFGFLEDVDRNRRLREPDGKPRKKPRKNWRKEIGT